jgi:hypothetical protein
MRKFWPKRFFLSNIVVGLSDNDPLLRVASWLEQQRPHLRDLVQKLRHALKSKLALSAHR